MGAELPNKLPQLWDLLLPECLKNYKVSFDKPISADEANQLVFSLQVLEIIIPNLDQSLFVPVTQCLNTMCLLLANPYKAVRHMASRCIAALASLNTKEVCASTI